MEIILLLDFPEYFNFVTQEDLYNDTSHLNSVLYFSTKDVFIFYLSLIIALERQAVWIFSTFEELGN